MMSENRTGERVQSAKGHRKLPNYPTRRIQSAKERRSTALLTESTREHPRTSLGDAAFCDKLHSQHKEKSHTIPKALQHVSQYISTELPPCLPHPALAGCIVMLPGLCDTYGHNLPTIPSPHDINSDYPYTHTLPSDTVHKPRKYSHPYYERLKKIKGWTCNHNGREIRVGSRSGETIHRFTIHGHRNESAIRDEIVELERLIKGLSTDWSTCTVALYQNEINDLQMKVKHTLSLTSHLKSSTEVYDPTGLRGFCEEYDTALQALMERHRQCMIELKEVEEIQRLYTRASQLDKCLD